MTRVRAETSVTMLQRLTLVLLAVNLVPADPIASTYTEDPFADEKKFKEVAIRHEILAIEKEKAVIPCQISSSEQRSDRPKLILWYKGTNKVPIYSFDLRKSSSGQHWNDNNTLGDRGFVYYEESPLKDSIIVNKDEEAIEVKWSSTLHIEPVYRGDAGKYRCRVDFTISPTFNSWVKLKVIVPPSAPVLENDRGDQLYGETDPLREGSSLVLHCHSAGNPVPSLSWRLGGIPLQPSSVHTDSSTGQIRSTITLKEVGGKDRGKEVECSAYNNDLTPPGKVTARVRVISPPGRVKIVRERESFTAGEKYNLTCQALGSSPVPDVRVMSGSTLLPLVYSQESPDGTVFSAVVQFTPTKKDHDQLLVCTAVNKLLPQATIEDQWKIDVHYGPLVSLSWMTEPLDLVAGQVVVVGPHGSPARTGEVGSLMEGEGLAMRCQIEANPHFHTIHWYRQDRDVESYLEDNIIIRGELLTIANILTNQGGLYYCSATNDVQTRVSNPLALEVKRRGHMVPGVGANNGILESCSSSNQTIHSFSLHCSVKQLGPPGSKPTPIIYQFEVYDSQTRTLVTNISSSSTSVTVTGLPPGTDYTVHVYTKLDGVQARSAEPLITEAFTSRVAGDIPEKMPSYLIVNHETNNNPIRFLPILGVLSGILLVLSVLTIGLVVAIKRKLVRGGGGGSAGQLCGPGSNSSSCAEGREWNQSPDILHHNYSTTDFAAASPTEPAGSSEPGAPTGGGIQVSSIEYAELSLSDTEALLTKPTAGDAGSPTIVYSHILPAGQAASSGSHCVGRQPPAETSATSTFEPGNGGSGAQKRTLLAASAGKAGKPPPPPRTDSTAAGASTGGGGGGRGPLLLLPPQAFQTDSRFATGTGTGGSCAELSLEPDYLLEINHPGSSLSLDVAPSEYLDKGILRAPSKRVKFRDEVPAGSYDTFPFRKDSSDQLCNMHKSHLLTVLETAPLANGAKLADTKTKNRQNLTNSGAESESKL